MRGRPSRELEGMIVKREGPLHGIKVIEVASIGPGPFAAMMLADLGAEVIRLARAGNGGALGGEDWNGKLRNRPSVSCDLKSRAGKSLVKELAQRADVLIEGYRPGVMERLGLGPDELLALNPGLVYGRVTGYGQTSPMAQQAGHDINYLAVTGALASFARAGDRPLAPINIVGDYGGGALMLLTGVLAALLERRSSGRGQVIDAAMTDGTALLMTLLYSMHSAGLWNDKAGTNPLDSGAPFYEVYETSDRKYLAVGAFEPQFYMRLLDGMGLDPSQYPQMDTDRWPEFKRKFADIIKTRRREEWAAEFSERDACVTPVYSLTEAPEHPHNVARETFLRTSWGVQPAPAPRFSRTPQSTPTPPVESDPVSCLKVWGLDETYVNELGEQGAFGHPTPKS